VSEPAEASAAPGMRGFVDGLTGALIDGWAFEPAHPTERVVVELRLDGETLATTVADRHRADLMRAGIGDAFHGFRFPLKPAWAERRADLVAVARGVEGGEAPLPLFQRGGPPATTANPQMVKAIERLAAGQRELETRLGELAGQFAALPVHQPEAPAPQAWGAPEESEQRLAVLEAWVARLDDQLAQLQQVAAMERVAPKPGIDTWQAVLIALLSVFGLGALATFALVLAL
jgi:hypothetical protein